MMYPEIDIDFRERTSGVGAGLFYADDTPVDETVMDLWAEYCNA